MDVVYISKFSFDWNTAYYVIKAFVITTGSGNDTVDVYQNYPTWGDPVNEYCHYAISIGSNTAGSFSTVLILPPNNDIIITVTPTANITILNDLIPTGIDKMIKSGIL